MKRFIVVLVALTMLASTASAAPGLLDFNRGAVGVKVQGAAINLGGVYNTYFVPAGYISYTLTSQLSASVEYASELKADPYALAQGDLNLALLGYQRGQRAQLGVSLGAVWYNDKAGQIFQKDKPWSYQVGLKGSYGFVKNKKELMDLYITGAVKLDLENEAHPVFYLALNAPLLKGAL